MSGTVLLSGLSDNDIILLYGESTKGAGVVIRFGDITSSGITVSGQTQSDFSIAEVYKDGTSLKKSKSFNGREIRYVKLGTAPAYSVAGVTSDWQTFGTLKSVDVADNDRLLMSNESASGDPNEYLEFDDLYTYIRNRLLDEGI